MKKTKTPNDWFVILWGNELKQLPQPTEKLVYMALKSFTANGKQSVALSLREIASRAGVSYVCVKKTIEKLTTSGMILVVGHEKRIGGSVRIFKVLTELTVKERKCYPSEHLTQESVNVVNESVNLVATRVAQSNKVSIESKDPNNDFVSSHEVSILAADYKLTGHEVQLELEKYLAHLPERKKPVKNHPAAFRRWILNAIKWGHLVPAESPEEKLQRENPDIPDILKRIK